MLQRINDYLEEVYINKLLKDATGTFISEAILIEKELLSLLIINTFVNYFIVWMLSTATLLM